MQGPSDLGQLKTQQWQRLQDLADRFEKAWEQTRDQPDPIDLNQFLPPAGDPLRAVALPELIKTDLEIRWRRGQIIGLEFYLEKFPELGASRTLAPQLVYEEYRVRHLYGDKPPLDKYRTRFPDQFPHLERLLQEQPLPTRHVSDPPASRAAVVPPAERAGSRKDHVLPVGGYKLVKRIGQGNFGEVWRAEAPGGVEVAIKIIARPLEHEEAQREMEALELIKRLRHPYLAATQAYWALEDRLYIVMELAEGSLRDRLKQCREAGQPGIPLPELLRYIRESAEALDYLHEEHVHHRDVKPENILLLKRHAKVADFGLARVLQSQRLMASATSSGTPAYMAPEVWRGKVSAHSDQYSLAVAYAELRLHRRLFAAEDMFGMMVGHAEKTPDLVPLELAEQQVLLKALAKDPAQRYENCLAFVRALEQAVGPELRRAGPNQFLDSAGEPLDDLGTDLGTLAPGSVPRQLPRGVSATDVESPDQPKWRPPKSSSARTWAILLLLLALGSVGFSAWNWLRPGSFTLEGVSPAAVRADESATLTFRIQRDRFQGPVELTFSGVPEHVHIDGATIASGADRVQVPLQADDTVEPGPVQITVHAAAGDRQQETTLEVMIQPLATLPAGCQPDRRVIAASTGKKYYEQISCARGGIPVVFRLIPHEREGDPEPFYIMQDKVWNDLFRQFAAERPQDLDNNSEWRLGGLADGKDVGIGNGRHPVLRVKVLEAHQFAKWLGGLLPTVPQWEKAAGCYAEGDRGPFQSGKDELDPNRQPPEVALNREKTGPLEVGKATHDRSRFGCRDMAGNGQEWTRTTQDAGLVPVDRPGKDLPVQVRGRSYGLETTGRLRFIDLTDYKKHVSDTQEYHLAYPEVGFRVVLEPR